MRKNHRASLGKKAVAAVLASAFFALPVFARTANDTYIDELWHLKKVGAFQAWDQSLGFEGIVVAIIDSGIDIDHPDLKENIWRNHKEVAGNGIDDDLNGYVDDVFGWDFVGDDGDPRPEINGQYSVLAMNHGTIDAGIVAARGDNGKGISGVSWQTSIMAIRALGSDGLGSPQDVVRAVEYAVHNGAKIINLSFAGPIDDPELAIAMRRAYDAGVFVVAAAGNAPEGQSAVDLDKNPLYPVCADAGAAENFVYGVAATDREDALGAFSNYGAGCVDISAPGARMLSTQFYVPTSKDFGVPYGGYYNGTSLAAAVVSGAASLMLAIDRNLTPKQLMNIFTETSVRIDAQNPGFFGKMGRGRVDAAAAVRKVIEDRKVVNAMPVTTTATLVAPGAGGLVVAAPASARKSEVRLFSTDGSYIRSFAAFPDGFKGGVSLAAADFDKTAKRSIVVGAGPGGAPHIRIFDINTRAIGGFYAYDVNFRGGVSVAAADVDGDGKDEIVTGVGRGGGPHVRIFTPAGIPVGGFFAFDQKRRVGVMVASGDLNGDGKDDIVAVEPNGTEVRVFDGQGNRLLSFASPAARDLMLADIDADGKKDIVVRSGIRTVVATAYRVDGKKIASFDPSSFTVIATLDSVQGKQSPALRLPGIVFGALSGGAPTVVAATASGAPTGFAAFESSFRGGVVAVQTE